MIELKESPLHGKGLFAKRNIKKGEKFLIKGKVLSLAKFFKIPKKQKDNCFRFSEVEYLTPKGELCDLLNHSCNPNGRIVKKGSKLYFEAIKSILKGKEFVFDYTTVLARDDFWVMKCNCKDRCRKKIDKFDNLPADLLKKYIKESIIPAYILGIETS